MSVFDGKAVSATPGSIIPATRAKRPDEYSFNREWDINQVFDPDIHSPVDIWVKYIVPYEFEIINDVRNKKQYYVSHVDPVTFKSTLLPLSWIEDKGTVDDYPLFPVSEYGLLQSEPILFLDYSTLPPVATVSSLAYSPSPAYAQLFYGNVINAQAGGKVISAVYVNNEIDDNRIPLKTIMPAGFNVENDVMKCTDKFSVSLPKEELKNGTRCTLVYFDEAGVPQDYYTVMVQHSTHLRGHQLSKRFVKSVELLSPWFTNSGTPRTLYLPINLPISNLVFQAKVNYSDGTFNTLPVNGGDEEGGFVLHGLNTESFFKPTNPGQVGGATLTYHFEPGEDAEIADIGSPNHKSVTYKLIATAAEGAWSPRLYVYPTWNPTGWKLRFFLGDLTRLFMLDVTQYVRLNNQSPVFIGDSYGAQQNLTYNLTLDDVVPSFTHWTFATDFSITLYNEGSSALRKWDVLHSKGLPAFGNLEIEYTPKGDNLSTAKFGGGFTNLTDFLAKAYYAVNPPVDITRENAPLVPTHMRFVRENGDSVTVPVGSFNNLILDPFNLINAETFFIVWVQRNVGGDELQLATSAAITRRV